MSYMKKKINEKMIILQHKKRNIHFKKHGIWTRKNKTIAGSTYFLQNDSSVQFITKI